MHLKNINKEKREVMCNKVKQRIRQEHPLLVKFYPVIEDEKSKCMYIPIEHFTYGNLSEFLTKLAKINKTHISEIIIIKFLYQLLMLLKSLKISDYITLKNLYFDEDFNVKFLNFSPFVTLTKFEVKMCDVGNIIVKLCTLSTTKKCNESTINKEYYSMEFIDLIESMLKDNTDVYNNIEQVFTHPTILLNTFKLHCGVKMSCLEILDYRTKLEILRKKEAAIKIKEYKIAKKEQALNAREKKISICEKTVRDKMTQAELYLRRCKEVRTSSQPKYENAESTFSAEYEALDCSNIIETSKKLDIDKLGKSPFIRTFSERKVKFKGHSPLKEMNFHRAKSVRKPKMKLSPSAKEPIMHKEKLILKSAINESDLFKDISNTETSLLKPTARNEDKKRRSVLFGPKSLVQNENTQNMDCRPIAWTEENKKQAFDLLRIMNSNFDHHIWNKDIKHTYL
ncbi:hypothetical protein HHI36_019421 [Cryptolaemus montrouzieri]|uniref:Protein kinase domain-containing protein n=1 Tax=Cryptolaemus montrouzieri TaxID=559131 RepID=A0ABD2P3L5_9CUCU